MCGNKHIIHIQFIILMNKGFLCSFRGTRNLFVGLRASGLLIKVSQQKDLSFLEMTKHTVALQL
jgi:5'(3')-deoxyribonucleotidase